MRTAAVAEIVVGLVVAAAILWFGRAAWRFYDRELLPFARSVPTITPTPVLDPEKVREDARRLRQVLDYVGAGIAMRQADQRDAAIRSFQQALDLDPSNFDARQNLVEMGAPTPSPPPGVILRTPAPPTATPLPTVTPRP
jgi:hypothetical protein